MIETLKIMGVMALLLVAHFLIRNRKCKVYNQSANQGTRCQFFIDEDRCSGWITDRENDIVTIHYQGKSYRRHITETYPV